MIRAVALALFAISVIACARADKPLAGWDRARWGMSASEIQTAYPAATPQKRDTHDYGGGRKYYCDLTLTGTTIAGYDFTVQFLMDNSDRLAAVHLAKEFNEDTYFSIQAVHAQSAYRMVEDLLVQKYGKPTEQSEQPESGRWAKWYLPNTKIELSGFWPSSLNRAPRIDIAYLKPGDTDKL